MSSAGFELDPTTGRPLQIAGYRIEAVAGRGGMGVVYRAQHMHLGRTVALKLLNPELAASEEFRERFIREARAAAELEHPNIVPVYDAGEVDGRLYLAMKFIEGTDLAELLEQETKLSADRAMPLLQQLADALDAAHRNGLIHRDVKPANALLEGDRLYLTDFGLTRRVDSTRPLTATGRAVGTAAYLAPEQIRGEPLDRRVDVYALGCVMYQCLAGQPPYLRDTDMLIMWAHVGAEPPSLSAEVPGLPSTVDRVIKKALAKSREDRYDTCGQLISEMKRALNPSQPLPTSMAEFHTAGMPERLPKVLLVTADPGTSLTVDAALRRSRLTLGQAADADAAKTRAANEPPDVVLLDASLENGGAMALVRALRDQESTRTTKIVLLTNPHARLDMGQLAPMVDDYLAYPFPPLQLFSTLREHIPEAFGESRWH
ncbi:MAG TPA: protein kinase [Thermoleophilaceae bacterium]|nr:protein kinase [Thermoleophilaceae bacterium]